MLVHVLSMDCAIHAKGIGGIARHPWGTLLGWSNIAPGGGGDTRAPGRGGGSGKGARVSTPLFPSMYKLFRVKIFGDEDCGGSGTL